MRTSHIARVLHEEFPRQAEPFQKSVFAAVRFDQIGVRPIGNDFHAVIAGRQFVVDKFPHVPPQHDDAVHRAIQPPDRPIRPAGQNRSGPQ